MDLNDAGRKCNAGEVFIIHEGTRVDGGDAVDGGRMPTFIENIVQGWRI